MLFHLHHPDNIAATLGARLFGGPERGTTMWAGCVPSNCGFLSVNVTAAMRADLCGGQHHLGAVRARDPSAGTRTGGFRLGGTRNYQYVDDCYEK